MAELVGLPLGGSVPFEISIQLVHRYAHTWPAVIEPIASGRDPTENLVSHDFALHEVAQAFATQRDDHTAMKVMIHPTRWCIVCGRAW